MKHRGSHSILEVLACKISEGLQTPATIAMDGKLNIFHRPVYAQRTADLAFINALISTGLRGSAIIDSKALITNHDQVMTAARRHIPLVININAGAGHGHSQGSSAYYANIFAVRDSGCFQLIARSPEEEIYLTLIAHRIAELSLMPGMVIADYDATDSVVELPADALIKAFLGDPDDKIDCPTPAQEMIFGKTRRRIPNWFNLDTPVMLGTSKNDAELSIESAATDKFFTDHLQQLAAQAFDEFRDQFNITLSPLYTQGKSSSNAVITYGTAIENVFNTIPEMHRKTEFLRVAQLHPFPEEIVGKYLQSKQSITILEPVGAAGKGHSPFYNKVIGAVRRSKQHIYQGKYHPDMDAETLTLAIEHMVSKHPQTEYFLGIDFTKDHSRYPKHEILLREIQQHYPEIQDASLTSGDTGTDSPPAPSREVPQVVRKYLDRGPNYTKLSRFYADTAFFYTHSDVNEIVADPFSALPVAPAASAGFVSNAKDREMLPVVDHSKCTACGDCFIYCPHSAIPPVALGAEQLMKSGVELASKNGALITKLTPMIRHFGKACSKFSNEGSVVLAKDLLPKAFDHIAGQMHLDEEALSIATREFEAVMDEIGSLPVALTDPLYNTPESIEKGSGSLFTLAVNPDTCTGCAVCAMVCEYEAIDMHKQDEELLAKTRSVYRLWEQLPDTPGETMYRLYKDESYHSLAAMLLSRNYSMTMLGGDGDEENNPYKTLLHIITATTEAVIQPRYVKLVKTLDDHIDRLSENIHDKLGNALPKENLEQLSKALDEAKGRRVSIQQVFSRFDSDAHGQLLDSEEMRRKTHLLEELKNLQWILTTGPGGVGRARYGLVLAGSESMAWARQYPFNQFVNPSFIHESGSAPHEALGLFYGHLRFVIDYIKLLRRAELEIKDAYDTLQHDSAIAGLQWDDLTGEEKQLVPPMLLVAERADLDNAGWNSMHRILTEDYPIKVCLFDHIAPPDNTVIPDLALAYSGVLSAIGLKNAFVFQGGMGNMQHLFEGLMDGIDRSFPALFNLYVARYANHDMIMPDWSRLAALALNSRTFPSLRFDPAEKRTFLNGAIDLDGNNDMMQDWVVEDIELQEGEQISYAISWADWAFTQIDWKKEFSLCESDPANIPITEYIALAQEKREGRVPVIMRADQSGLKYYAASEKVVRVTGYVLANWNTLQELAGLITEFPEVLKKRVTEELQKTFEQARIDLEKEFNKKFKDHEAAQTEILRQRLKEKLIALSTMARDKTKS